MHDVSELLGDAVDLFNVKSLCAKKCIITFFVFFRSYTSIRLMPLCIGLRGTHNGVFVKERLEQLPVAITGRTG